MRVQIPLVASVVLAAATPALAVSARAHHAVLARSYNTRRDSCVCPSSDATEQATSGSSTGSGAASQGQSAVSSGGSSGGSGAVVMTTSANAPALTLPKAKGGKKNVPKVKPSKKSLTQGTSQGVSSFVSSGVISPAAGQALQQAITQAINNNTHTTTAPTSAVDNSNNVVYTSSQTSSSGQNLTAIVDIQQAIQDALNAATLAESNLNASTKAQLQNCLSTILSNGGLPTNYTCISQSGSTSAGLQQTLNNILEQFLGILPNKILDAVFNAIDPQLTTLLPDEQTLVTDIENSIKSVIASASGGSVTALEDLNNCYTTAVQNNGNVSYANCFTSSGAYDAIESSMNGMLQQFIGVLPPNLISAVQNLVAYNLGTTNNASSNTVYQQLNNAILSVGASLSGSTATTFESFESCAHMLLVEGNAAGASNCTTSAAIQDDGSTLVDSFVQQFSGYVPASLLSDLTAAVQPYLNGTNSGSVSAALQAAFNNADLGPGYVSCFEQIQACVVKAVETSGKTNATCAGPVAGCERIGASGASASAAIVPIYTTSITSTTTQASPASSTVTSPTTTSKATNSASKAPTSSA